ncbi:MAG: 50S ribosomal protein L32 [Candidatus Doudnabacteria bacterium]|nr:50S ribosomal protein L32 [Candidatus Doudnabacteria bacterium]
MAAAPKRKMSSSRKGRRLAHQWKAKLAQLTKSPSGKLVMPHMVTPENPFYKGVKFLRTKAKRVK